MEVDIIGGEDGPTSIFIATSVNWPLSIKIGSVIVLMAIGFMERLKAYYYFQLANPDGNVIEVTGEYAPKEGEFDELIEFDIE